MPRAIGLGGGDALTGAPLGLARRDALIGGAAHTLQLGSSGAAQRGTAGATEPGPSQPPEQRWADNPLFAAAIPLLTPLGPHQAPREPVAAVEFNLAAAEQLQALAAPDIEMAEGRLTNPPHWDGSTHAPGQVLLLANWVKTTTFNNPRATNLQLAEMIVDSAGLVSSGPQAGKATPYHHFLQHKVKPLLAQHEQDYLAAPPPLGGAPRPAYTGQTFVDAAGTQHPTATGVVINAVRAKYVKISAEAANRLPRVKQGQSMPGVTVSPHEPLDAYFTRFIAAATDVSPLMMTEHQQARIMLEGVALPGAGNFVQHQQGLKGVVTYTLSWMQDAIQAFADSCVSLGTALRGHNPGAYRALNPDVGTPSAGSRPRALAAAAEEEEPDMRSMMRALMLQLQSMQPQLGGRQAPIPSAALVTQHQRPPAQQQQPQQVGRRARGSRGAREPQEEQRYGQRDGRQRQLGKPYTPDMGSQQRPCVEPGCTYPESHSQSGCRLRAARGRPTNLADDYAQRLRQQGEAVVAEQQRVQRERYMEVRGPHVQQRNVAVVPHQHQQWYAHPAPQQQYAHPVPQAYPVQQLQQYAHPEQEEDARNFACTLYDLRVAREAEQSAEHSRWCGEESSTSFPQLAALTRDTNPAGFLQQPPAPVPSHARQLQATAGGESSRGDKTEEDEEQLTASAALKELDRTIARQQQLARILRRHADLSGARAYPSPTPRQSSLSAVDAGVAPAPAAERPPATASSDWHDLSSMPPAQRDALATSLTERAQMPTLHYVEGLLPLDADGRQVSVERTLVDTGSEACIMDQATAERLRRELAPSSARLSSIGGKGPVRGQMLVPLGVRRADGSIARLDAVKFLVIADDEAAGLFNVCVGLQLQLQYGMCMAHVPASQLRLYPSLPRMRAGSPARWESLALPLVQERTGVRSARLAALHEAIQQQLTCSAVVFRTMVMVPHSGGQRGRRYGPESPSPDSSDDERRAVSEEECEAGSEQAEEAPEPRQPQQPQPRRVVVRVRGASPVPEPEVEQDPDTEGDELPEEATEGQPAGRPRRRGRRGKRGGTSRSRARQAQAAAQPQPRQESEAEGTEPLPGTVLGEEDSEEERLWTRLAGYRRAPTRAELREVEEFAARKAAHAAERRAARAGQSQTRGRERQAGGQWAQHTPRSPPEPRVAPAPADLLPPHLAGRIGTGAPSQTRKRERPLEQAPLHDPEALRGEWWRGPRSPSPTWERAPPGLRPRGSSPPPACERRRPPETRGAAVQRAPRMAQPNRERARGCSYGENHGTATSTLGSSQSTG